MFEDLIHKPLDGLKMRLVDRKLTIPGGMGRVEEASFSFNEPATEEEIQGFIRRTGFRMITGHFSGTSTGPPFSSSGTEAGWNCAVC
ncbi:hypothetical protein [Planifilum fimeticola]|nr:hypothetical protein [Planifilum fimeticola]